MAVEAKAFGTSRDGREITLYTISNSKGMKAGVMNLGATLVTLEVPDAKGNVQDLVLGFDHGEDYYGNGSFFGTVIGPSANRIGGAAYEIDGTNYMIDMNDGENNLHSHFELGYHKRMWEATTTDNSVTFTLEDPATLGFPGVKVVSVTYSVSEENEIKLHYHGTSDEKTIINLTNHTYFNLDGEGTGRIENHKIQLEAANYTPCIPGSIPTGEIAPVAGTPMDLTKMIAIGEHIGDDFDQLVMAKGYDHNYVIDGYKGDGTMQLCATVEAEKSGRVMKVYTDLPGVQFYAGNCIAPIVGKGGKKYDKRYGFCLETQYYPDTIHHENFPSCLFGGEEGKEYDSVTVYRFE